MSDTRNHTTRDQLAEALCRGAGDRVCINYDPDVKGGCSWCELDADALLASDAIAAVRAAAVAETTAAIEAALDGLSGKRDLFWQRYLNAETGHSEALNQGRFEGYAEAQSTVRAALSGGRTAHDTCGHPNHHGPDHDCTPFRADTGADQ